MEPDAAPEMRDIREWIGVVETRRQPWDHAQVLAHADEPEGDDGAEPADEDDLRYRLRIAASVRGAPGAGAGPLGGIGGGGISPSDGRVV